MDEWTLKMPLLPGFGCQATPHKHHRSTPRDHDIWPPVGLAAVSKPERRTNKFGAATVAEWLLGSSSTNENMTNSGGPARQKERSEGINAAKQQHMTKEQQNESTN